MVYSIEMNADTALMKKIKIHEIFSYLNNKMQLHVVEKFVL